MSHHFPRWSVAVAFVITALLGCSSHKEEEGQQQPPAAQAPEPERTTGAERNEITAPALEEPASPGSNIASERQAESPAVPDEKMAPISDEQTIRILTTVNSGEVEQAQVAQRKAKDPRVKKFAAQMIEQHTKAKDKITKLSKSEQLMPANGSVANDLAENGSQTLASLNAVEGPDFDKTYMDAQVQQHQEVLDLINTRLIPSATNAQLKSALDDTKSMVERHLQSAQQIQAQMQR